MNVHANALCESEQIGSGTRIWPFAQVMAGAVIGRDCNIGGGAFVESGAVLGDRVTVKNQVMIWDGVCIEDDVFIGPGVIFSNDLYPRSPRMPEAAQKYSDAHNWRLPTVVKRGATLGAGAVVLPGLTIGEFAMIGAAAVVTRDVAAYRLAVGNPARLVGRVCLCGNRLHVGRRCPRCGTTSRTDDEGLMENVSGW